MARPLPAFDPQGPPDPLRWAVERLLSRGLVDVDSSGRVVPAAAESVSVSSDGLVYSFHLRKGLRFSDGTPCGSDAFRRSLEAGLNRLDHGTYAWLLGSLSGMDRVRPGRPLPALGLSNPDDRTLVLRLAHPDPLLLRKLAVPGIATPWRGGSGPAWRDGIGHYKVAASDAASLTLARRGGGTGPDTLFVKFVPGEVRLRSMLRAGTPDLVWPLPPNLLDQALPSGYVARTRPAWPARRLLLVMRADLPPTTKPEARHALADGVSREDVVAGLGTSGTADNDWLPGGSGFDFPRRDAEGVRDWLERGKLGRSLHVVMSYSADGPAARVARSMQAEWARVGLDIELRPLRQPKAVAEAMKAGGAQLLLVESQAVLETPEAELAMLIVPRRGAGVGAFRTGWRTREFDRWIEQQPGAPPLDVDGAQQRLGEEDVVLPLAGLPWLWVTRSGHSVEVHPTFGPNPIPAKPAASVASR